MHMPLDPPPPPPRAKLADWSEAAEQVKLLSCRVLIPRCPFRLPPTCQDKRKQPGEVRE